MKNAFKYIFSMMFLFVLLLSGDGLTTACQKLNRNSNGQLLYSISSGSEDPLIVIFRKLDKNGTGFICSPLHNPTKGYREELGRFNILPITEKIQDWELTTYALYTLSHIETNDKSLDALCIALLKWRGGARSVDIRDFLNKESSFLSYIKNQSYRLASRKGSVRHEAAEKLRKAMEEKQDEPLQIIERQLDKKDFFAAFCLYARHRSDIQLTLGNRGDFLLKKIFASWDDAVIQPYCDARKNGNACETAFLNLFPNASGPWKSSLPVTYTDLIKLIAHSYQGFLDTRNYSSLCDFFQWGNGMLSVLATTTQGDSPEDNPTNLAATKEFDDALQKYTQLIQKTGN